MTQISLLDRLEAPARVSDLELLRRYFAARPNVWIGLPELGTVISPFSVTARCRDLRKPQFGAMAIENRTQRVGGRAHSEYRWTK